MNKKRLIEMVARSTGHTIKETTVIVNQTFALLAREIVKSGIQVPDIHISGLGKISADWVKDRARYNFQTQQMEHKPYKLLLRLKLSRKMTEQWTKKKKLLEKIYLETDTEKGK